jgi:hypothetical protein
MRRLTISSINSALPLGVLRGRAQPGLAIVMCVMSIGRVGSANSDPFATPNPAPAPVAPSATKATIDEPEPPKATEPVMRTQLVIDLPACDVVDPGKPRRRAALWVAAGGGAMWLGTFALGLYEKRQFDAAVARSDQNTNEDAQHAQLVTRWYGTGMFAAGAVLFGASAYLYLTAPSKESVTRTAVVPTASSDQVGLSVVGGF